MYFKACGCISIYFWETFQEIISVAHYCYQWFFFVHLFIFLVTFSCTVKRSNNLQAQKEKTQVHGRGPRWTAATTYTYPGSLKINLGLVLWIRCFKINTFLSRRKGSTVVDYTIEADTLPETERQALEEGIFTQLAESYPMIYQSKSVHFHL